METAGGESFRLIHRPRFYYFAEFRMMYGRRGYMALPCFIRGSIRNTSTHMDWYIVRQAPFLFLPIAFAFD